MDPFYQGFFTCFNEQKYYEAHDVLEHLWLKTEGKNHLYYKGLIQIAGAFVHLQKNFLRPNHPKDGQRLRPAARLFKLGITNLEAYRPFYMHLDIENLRRLCLHYSGEIIGSDFHRNPWNPAHPPKITLSLEK